MGLCKLPLKEDYKKMKEGLKTAPPFSDNELCRSGNDGAGMLLQQVFETLDFNVNLPLKHTACYTECSVRLRRTEHSCRTLSVLLFFTSRELFSWMP